MNNKNWDIEYLPEAVVDIAKLDGSVVPQVLKAIAKISTNPLPQSEGGFGKALGNKAGHNLAGLLKVKLKKSGIRIIYYLVRDKDKITIVIVGARTDNEVYKQADLRISKALK